MELAQNQIDFYNENGYLAVENVFSESEIDDLRRVTGEFVEQTRGLTEHTSVFDLDFEAGHSAQTPKLRRITGPHKLHPVYDATMRNSKVLDVIECLIGPDVRLHHTKLNMKAPGGGACPLGSSLREALPRPWARRGAWGMRWRPVSSQGCSVWS